MKTHPLARRRFRVGLCLGIAVLAAVFLYWDAASAQERTGAIPGPQYLVLWFGIVTSGIVALAVLAIDASILVVRHARLGAPDGGSGGDLPGRMLPRH